MKKFNFEQVLDRRGRDSIAVDGLGLPGCPGEPKKGFDVIPMWVADMNFAVPPSIVDALVGRASHLPLVIFRRRRTTTRPLSTGTGTERGSTT